MLQDVPLYKLNAHTAVADARRRCNRRISRPRAHGCCCNSASAWQERQQCASSFQRLRQKLNALNTRQ